MTIIGELYQAGTQNTYCRSKRPVAESECNYGACVQNSCNEGEHDMQFYSYSAEYKGLAKKNAAMPTPRFMCEEP